MEPSIEYLLQKYGISPKDQQNNYSFKDSARSQISFKETENKSLTVSAKPIQDKIKLLESYNIEYETENQRLKSEISDLKSKMHGLMLQKEKEASNKNIELDSQLKILSGKNKSLEEQNAFLRSQIDFYEEENKRSTEQYLIDKEN